MQLLREEIDCSGWNREGRCFKLESRMGFFSEKDGEIHHFDLCEPCYDAIVSEFKIPVDVEEQKEFL